MGFPPILQIINLKLIHESNAEASQVDSQADSQLEDI